MTCTDLLWCACGGPCSRAFTILGTGMFPADFEQPITHLMKSCRTYADAIVVSARFAAGGLCPHRSTEVCLPPLAAPSGIKDAVRCAVCRHR